MSRKSVQFAMLSVAVLVIIIGCNLPQGGPASTSAPLPTPTLDGLPFPTDTVSSPTGISPTATQNLEPTATPQPAVTETSPAETAVSGPACTLLQDLNFRTGPGTAYNPPIRALPAQTVLIPTAFNPVGIPGGPWVQVTDPSTSQSGWVSAGNQYVSCNIDLSALPSVNVPTPEPPKPPEANNSTPDGTFPPNFVWDADFNDDYFVRFKVYDTTSGSTEDGSGITEVSFQVLDSDGNEVYQRTERTSGYCIFGGGEPDCNPWVYENNTYKWESDGDAVKTGKYKLLIVVTAASGEQGNWNYDIDLKLPD